MEHHIVDLGDGSTTVMDPATATDENSVQRMRDWSAQQRSEREHTESVLRGIEEASKS